MTDKSICVMVDHRTYSDKPLVGEVTNDRLWRIARLKPVTDGEFMAARHMSIFWYNTQLHGCEYNAAIHRRLKDTFARD